MSKACPYKSRHYYRVTGLPVPHGCPPSWAKWIAVLRTTNSQHESGTSDDHVLNRFNERVGGRGGPFDDICRRCTVRGPVREVEDVYLD